MAIRVQNQDFSIEEEIKALKAERTDIGAIVTFTGTVRDLAGSTAGNTTGKTPITTMHLEHYPGMTEKQLEDIQLQAHQRWPIIDSTIIHRIGDLAPGENIVLVITLSAHRHAAFEAADFLMDFLKSKAPFWKKEQPTTGEARWVDARESDSKALSRWSQSKD